MNKLTKLVGVAAFALGLGTAATAATIEGEIAINLFGLTSTVSVDTTTDQVTFSAGPNAQVGSATGDYIPLFGLDATYSNFNYGASFVSGEIWWVNATSYFVLESITPTPIETANGGVTLLGLGTAYLTDFEATPGAWSFSADRALSTAAFSFSSTTTVPPRSVPEGGTTAALLGLSLVGAGLIARRRRS